MPGDGLPDLLAGPDNGIAAVDAYLAASKGPKPRPANPPASGPCLPIGWWQTSWTQEEGRIRLRRLDVEAQHHPNCKAWGTKGRQVSLPQYGIDYVEVKGVRQGVTTIQFEGRRGDAASCLRKSRRCGCWWTNRGDDTGRSTLTREA